MHTINSHFLSGTECSITSILEFNQNQHASTYTQRLIFVGHWRYNIPANEDNPTFHYHLSLLASVKAWMIYHFVVLGTQITIVGCWEKMFYIPLGRK